MRAIRLRAFILTLLLVAPTGRRAAGVARVSLFQGRRQLVRCVQRDAIPRANKSA